MGDLQPGQIRLRGVSRSFRIVHERNQTLKETVLRRRRMSATELWALKDVDLDIAPGEAVGVIGQNGAGKSTLLKLVAGILPPQKGSVETCGSVASMLELGAGFHPDFTGRENVFMNAAILGLDERSVERRLPEIVAFSELDEFIDMPVKTYSSGMQMRLAFAVASHINPDILLLDEILAVGDEAFQRKCFGRIFDFRRRGGTLLYVSHDPASIERVCDRVIVLGDGHILADDRPNVAVPIYHRRLAGLGQVKATADDEAVSALNQAAHNAPVDDDRVWGTREVTIREVRLLGEDGPSDSFLSGRPFSVELDVESLHPVGTPAFGVGIVTPDGIMCYGTNTRLDEWPIPSISGRATVRFTIPRLMLHEGRFEITVAAVSQDESVIYHWLDRWKQFTVFPAATGGGLVDLSGTWTLSTQPAESNTSNAEPVANSADPS